MAEHSSIEIDGHSTIQALTCSANGKYLMSGGEGVRVWQVEDGKEVATMKATDVQCLAVSNDGRYIAAGTSRTVFVWDAKTYQQACTLDESYVTGVDFSPDSTRLATATHHGTTSIWDVAARKRIVGPLRHEVWVRAAKYSPKGDQIATATSLSVRIYDSNNGHLLADIPVKLTPLYNTGLLWSNDDLFIVSDGKIKQMNASTESVVSEWLVPESNLFSCIALPQHGQFLAYSVKHTVTFWDTSRHVLLSAIQHTEDIRSIAFSPDARSLTIGGKCGKISISSLSDFITLPRLLTFREPDIQIDYTILHSWKHGQPANVEALLTAALPLSQNSSHHVFAGRALVRSRSQQWDLAIDDAKQSIEIKPSVIGYIAMSVALVGKGENLEGYRACDIAFQHLRSTAVNFLLLVKAIIVFMAGEHDDAISRLDDLITTVPLNSICYVVQAYMYLLLGNSCMESKDYGNAIPLFERARTQMRYHKSRSLFIISLISGWKFDSLGITIRQRLCEALYAADRTEEGGDSLIEMVDTFGDEVYMSKPITKWVSDFTRQCLSTSRSESIESPEAGPHSEATMARMTCNSSTLVRLSMEWAKSTLASASWRDALVAAGIFIIPRFTIYWAMCECLEMIDNVTDVISFVQKMASEFAQERANEQAEFIIDLKSRCCSKLEGLGDTTMNAQQYDEAISLYSTALSLEPTAPQLLFSKRSRAYEAKGLWNDALSDANEVITLNPLSPIGYERKYMASRGAGHHKNASEAFETMLLKMSQSPDATNRNRYCQYTETKEIIRTAIQDAIRELPQVLIDTTSGRLCNRSEQAAAFESLPVFTGLISSVSTAIDHARIQQTVAEYYRYATFSHKWEDSEPLFEKVTHVMVYDLEESPTHDKLQMFCMIVRDAGFHWAWSDTCCINKADHQVLQEALVLMFKWYEGSAVTIVLLRGVRSPSRHGDLTKSIWNSRTWTLQEYHASKVVRFYNEDWTPYLNLHIPNHKESSEIVSEMEEATGVSARSLMSLRPGLDDIREKLRLASTRQTTRVEDAAYSLFGIFSVSLPVVYGEGDKALGRLLAQLLTSSGNAAILAWTGRSGSFNSCLPAEIAVFSQLQTTHIPQTIQRAELDAIAARLLTSSINLPLVMEFYTRLNEVPVPFFVGQRMKLPCISFKLGPVFTQEGSEYVFRAQTVALGIVEIRTREDLSLLESLYLVHPWIGFLLDRQPVRKVARPKLAENASGQTSWMGESPCDVPLVPRTRTARFINRSGKPPGGPRNEAGDAESLRPPSSTSETEKQMRAFRVVAQLRQPFGALLLTPHLGNVSAYRRVAEESPITVQVEEITPAIMNKLVNSVRVLDVL